MSDNIRRVESEVGKFELSLQLPQSRGHKGIKKENESELGRKRVCKGVKTSKLRKTDGMGESRDNIFPKCEASSPHTVLLLGHLQLSGGSSPRIALPPLHPVSMLLGFCMASCIMG